MNTPFIDTAKIMSKGQVTIPKDVRNYLKLSVGDRVTFICEEDKVIIANPAIYAMKELQKAMAGEAEKAGIDNEDDVVAMIKELREEDRI